MPSISASRATLDDLYREESKAELIGGRIVRFMASGDLPSIVAFEIAVSLRAYARASGQGVAYPDGIGFTIPELPSGRESFSPDASYYVGRGRPTGCALLRERRRSPSRCAAKTITVPRRKRRWRRNAPITSRLARRSSGTLIRKRKRSRFIGPRLRRKRRSIGVAISPKRSQPRPDGVSLLTTYSLHHRFDSPAGSMGSAELVSFIRIVESVVGYAIGLKRSFPAPADHSLTKCCLTTSHNP